MLLSALGHQISGFALDPDQESLFYRAAVDTRLTDDIRGDIRDRALLISEMKRIRPDYVLHFAAQALVLEGYRRPAYTYETNVMGTLNVLEATAATDSVRAQLIVTTDKVYRDEGQARPYKESDPLGGKDPYSASKAAADILAQERLSAIDSKPGAIARAGNVIGAGDYSKNRLLPDLVRAVQAKTPLSVRNPRAIRPWQHVLDCLNGYLILLEAVEHQAASGAWNIAPTAESPRTVADVLTISKHFTDFDELYPETHQDTPVEAPFLALETSKAREQLSWHDHLDIHTSIEWALVEIPELHEGDLEGDVASQISRFANFLSRPHPIP